MKKNAHTSSKKRTKKKQLRKIIRNITGSKEDTIKFYSDMTFCDIVGIDDIERVIQSIEKLRSWF